MSAPGDAPAPNVRAMSARVSSWIGDRLGWPTVRATLTARRSPRLGLSHYLGGITLFLLLLQVASGVLLLLYYQPDAGQAHASVQRIIGGIPYGRLVRATHLWVSDLFVGFLLAHGFAVVMRRSYRAPHELAWVGGLVALFLGIGLAFTGAILPWSASAQTHARVGSDLARHVPLVGETLRRFMRGGDEVTGSTLGHAFGFHVAALPATLTLVLAVHLLIILLKRRDDPSADDRSHIPVYPDFLVRGAALTTAVLIVTMTLVVFIDRPLGAPASLAASPEAGAHPPWYLLPVHQIVRLAPTTLLGIDGARFLVGATCTLSLVVIALPFIDPRGSRITAWVALGVLVLLIVLGSYALL